MCVFGHRSLLYALVLSMLQSIDSCGGILMHVAEVRVIVNVAK